MTEPSWLTGADPAAMLQHLTVPLAMPQTGRRYRPPASDRKLRLFACAAMVALCGKRHDYIDVVEAFADDPGMALPYRTNYSYLLGPAAEAATISCLPSASAWQPPGQGVVLVNLLREIFGNPWQPPRLCSGDQFPCSFCGGTGEAFQVDAVIPGKPPVNPRPVECMCCDGSGVQTHDSEWPCGGCERVGAAARLVAEDVYAGRDFSRLAVLADAIEEAGCRSIAVLDHLRSPDPRVRGCWALDLVLGKS